jgi:hypothetical protein
VLPTGRRTANDPRMLNTALDGDVASLSTSDGLAVVSLRPDGAEADLFFEWRSRRTLVVPSAECRRAFERRGTNI